MAETKLKQGRRLKTMDVWICPHCYRLFKAWKSDYGKVQECSHCQKPVKLVDSSDRSVEE